MLKTVFSVAALAFVVGLVGCGANEVKKEDVEKIASEQLSAASPGKPAVVTCPAGLKGTVGATLTCTMPVDGKAHDVNIKVSSVEAGTVKFDIAVADAKP